MITSLTSSLLMPARLTASAITSAAQVVAADIAQRAVETAQRGAHRTDDDSFTHRKFSSNYKLRIQVHFLQRHSERHEPVGAKPRLAAYIPASPSRRVVAPLSQTKGSAYRPFPPLSPPLHIASIFPPTSYSASVICPRLQQRTASINSAKILSPARATCCSRFRAAGRRSLACRF
jgi:hypothetical protein